MNKRWTQPAELLFEHSEDDGKDYVIGVYIPAFDHELGSTEAYDSAIAEWINKGTVINGRTLKDFIELAKP